MIKISLDKWTFSHRFVVKIVMSAGRKDENKLKRSREGPFYTK